MPDKGVLDAVGEEARAVAMEIVRVVVGNEPDRRVPVRRPRQPHGPAHRRLPQRKPTMIPAPHAGAHAHAHSRSHSRNPMIGTAIGTAIAPATTKINSTTKNSAMICLAA